MLILDEIDVSYGPISALRKISLKVPEGAVVAIIGANGAGKSSLLKSIAGWEIPTSGSIRFIDRSINHDITRLPSHKRTDLGIALSPEGRGIFPDQSVRDNLMLGAYLRRHDPAGIERDILHAFARFPILGTRQHQPAGTLSGGEQQMLAITRALMSAPKLLLLDEPSLGLAPLMIQEIFATICALRDEGLTIVLVEQMANQALAIADYAYVLETGDIIQHGKGADLMHDPKVRAAYLGMH
ncbi:ABC transporter ATP-binding protein [Glaciimonas immobilis]|uniref:Branched-chain amino acid transport system ATP-binding protein n=1 Tax=Glaciimonas immobilis TaxID=728004 RepID=A0A840RXQ4_9BURK|nr:ABC transporter ATP-binding protein [Glaciimonas immobilis]KAF3996463.1 ABC transporter ATP-binding protein [Glaciimonas immobilis]MBB5201189.1 branched-chain amino acid transport system ATP-binding protein [Glaciimonas immobilis]